MYVYDKYDHQIVKERVNQFREQTRRYLAGELTDPEFLPLRLQNGLYIQRYAPMLRIAVPYGLLSSTQVRKLAEITRKYDKGYAHISTRTNVQLNWPDLEDVPEILAGDLQSERGAQATVKAGIAHCESVRDYISREILERILEDTEEHIDWLETQIDLLSKVGLQNYLQSQMGDSAS